MKMFRTPDKLGLVHRPLNAGHGGLKNIGSCAKTLTVHGTHRFCLRDNREEASFKISDSNIGEICLKSKEKTLSVKLRCFVGKETIVCSFPKKKRKKYAASRNY